ncbi:unnamed protein product [Rotaria magnacalcarata]|uniref:Uncharacterized protein n=1 Tax=Rotaria magnacalcarata TaxID=392030 RepID=A0A815Y994_9BILA|nr:unnamed protein product [Rotaria magnacalcarata]
MTTTSTSTTDTTMTSTTMASSTTTTSTTTSTTISTTTTTAYTSPNQCGGISQTSLWTVYDATSITMALDTRKCNFTVAPAYFTSIGGIDRQRYLRGYNNIYGPTTTTFRIYIHSLLGESSAILLNYSQTYAWTIYWFGSKYTNQTNQSATDPTFCKGTGLSSQALWYAYDNYTMTMNVDTTICNLNETRLYFTSLGGTGNHYLMQAYNGIYSTTINSFRVYANSMLGWSVSNMLSYASSLAWNLNWFALAQTYQSYTSTTCTYPCPCGSVSSWPLWQYEDAYTLMMNVNTTMCGFNQMPVYFTSIGGINGQYLLQSYTSIYSPTQNSFQTYLRHQLGWNASVLLSYAQTYLWDLNWFGLYY